MHNDAASYNYSNRADIWPQYAYLTLNQKMFHLNQRAFHSMTRCY